MESKKVADQGPELDHIKWLISSRGKNNTVALKLLGLFQKYPKRVRTDEFHIHAQHLVSIAFSLWRAAFLTDTAGGITKFDHAEQFLKKLLVDNQISFVQDRAWREWTVNYYNSDARLRLSAMQQNWPGLALGQLLPPSGQSTSKQRWAYLHRAFEKAVQHFATELRKAKGPK